MNTSIDDLYKIFSSIGDLKERLKEDPEHENMIRMLDEILKLRGEVEKLKQHNQTYN